jgi:hypothetical protein
MDFWTEEVNEHTKEVGVVLKGGYKQIVSVTRTVQGFMFM